MSASGPETVLSAFKRLVLDHASRALAGEPPATPPEVAGEGHPLFGERRKEARYMPVARRAYVGWWEDGTFRTASARVENLSRGGAAVLVEGSPPALMTPAWLCLIGPVRPDWYAGQVVDRAETAGAGRVVRVALARPLPYDVFKAVVWGIPSGEPDRGAPAKAP
jgi:hypothetical protein